MVGKPVLPNLSPSSYFRAQGVRKASLDELDGVFECYIPRWCEQKMDVLRHKDERRQTIASVTAMTIQRPQEKAHVGFDDKESSPLPG